MPRIDVGALRDSAAGFRRRGEEVRARTSHISQLSLSLADHGRWSDARYAAFQRRFDEQTQIAAEFADRLDGYADWLRKVADEIEGRWGESMHVG